MIGRVPIASEKNRETVGLKEATIVQEGWNDCIAAVDPQSPSRQKIILYVGEEQCIMRSDGNHGARREDGRSESFTSGMTPSSCLLR